MVVAKNISPDGTAAFGNDQVRHVLKLVPPGQETDGRKRERASGIFDALERARRRDIVVASDPLRVRKSVDHVPRTSLQHLIVVIQNAVAQLLAVHATAGPIRGSPKLSTQRNQVDAGASH